MVKIPLYAEHLRIDEPGFLCISETRGRVTLRLEGLGDGTNITQG